MSNYKTGGSLEFQQFLGSAKSFNTIPNQNKPEHVEINPSWHKFYDHIFLALRSIACITTSNQEILRSIDQNFQTACKALLLECSFRKACLFMCGQIFERQNICFMQCCKFQNKFYNTVAMLSPELLQKFSSNMAFQRVNSVQRDPDHLFSEEQYKDLMVTVFQVKYFKGNDTRSFYCGSLNLSRETSYLAKLYLDIIFNKLNFVDINQLTLLSLCCVWMAVKFNEPVQVSLHFDAQTICQQAQYSFSVSDLIQMELHILQLLEYKLKYTTPYDYIQPFFQSFPWIFKLEPALQSIIELSVMIRGLRSESSADIFYGTFVGIIELKNCTLGPLQKSILRSQIRDQAKIGAISQAILYRYNQILMEEGKEEDMQSEQTQIQ